MIKLLLHTVLIKLDDATEVDDVYRRAKAAGIELSLDKRESKAVEYGTVVQVGPTAFMDYGRDSSILKEGDRVSITKYSGKEVVDSDNSKFVIVNDSDVLCIVQ
jgi:co-chaperonin GroES (HSP10)